MLVQDTSEFELIEALAKSIAAENAACVARLGRRGYRLRLGIGDDAAAWDVPRGTSVITTDTMVESVHFNTGQISWRDLGWKSLASNLSDIAAMGCMPLYTVVTLGLRGDLAVENLEEMYKGMVAACTNHGGAIVGGDIVKAPVFFISVAMEGVAIGTDGEPEDRALLSRFGAQPADQVAVTGTLGSSAGGLRMLVEGLDFSKDVADHLASAHNHPIPRVKEGWELVRAGVKAAIDISDGLIDDLGKLCEASGVGASVTAGRIPVDGHLKRAYPDEWLELALSGGEEYELLFTAPQDVMERTVTTLEVPVSVIGEIVADPLGVEVFDASGDVITVEQGGWNHFG